MKSTLSIMDENWFLPHVLDIIGDRREIPWAIKDFSGIVSEKLHAFIASRLAWVSSLTGLTFPEDNESPFLIINRTHEIPTDVRTDGMALATDEGLNTWQLVNPTETNDRAQFIAIHEIGHVLGLSHPFDDSLNLSVTNEQSIMSGTKLRSDSYNTFFSPLDIQHLQQAHWAKDPITGISKKGKIIGTPGPDVVMGTSRNEKIRGNTGPDLLYGGGGKDTFILERSVPGYFQYDLIQDFGKGDRIQLKGNMNAEKLTISSDGNDKLLYYKSELLAHIANASFMDESYILS